MPRVLAAVTAGVLLAGAAGTPPQDPPKKPEPAAQEKEVEGRQAAATGVLPSAALRLGADLEGAAPVAFVKWARKFSKREILDSAAPPKGEAVAIAVQTTYPQAPAAAREAGEVLVWYLAYKQGARALEIAAVRVRDLEKDMGFLQDDLQRLRSTPVPISQAGAARDAEDRVLFNLEQVTRQRDLHKRVADMIRARVDLCIDRLAAASASHKDRDPAAIRGLK